MSIVSTENSDHYIWGNDYDGWRLAKTNNLSAVQECVPSGCAEVRHFYNVSEQFCYVLSGEVTLEVDGMVHKVGDGIYSGFCSYLLNISGRVRCIDPKQAGLPRCAWSM